MEGQVISPETRQQIEFVLSLLHIASPGEPGLAEAEKIEQMLPLTR